MEEDGKMQENTANRVPTIFSVFSCIFVLLSLFLRVSAIFLQADTLLAK